MTASVAGAAVVNTNGTKMLLANDVSKLFIKCKPVLINKTQKILLLLDY